MNINDFPVPVRPMIQTIVDQQDIFPGVSFVASYANLYIELQDLIRAVWDGWEQPIKPGDTVKWTQQPYVADGEVGDDYRVQAEDGEVAWVTTIHSEDHDLISLSELVRIDPT